jgi:hypothetical protein
VYESEALDDGIATKGNVARQRSRTNSGPTSSASTWSPAKVHLKLTDLRFDKQYVR